MTLYKYGFKFNTRSSKLNINAGLYPVFDSIFQQLRQVMLSPEAKFPLKDIKDLTFSLECHNTIFGKELTMEVANKHDLNFYVFSSLDYMLSTLNTLRIAKLQLTTML